MKKLEPLLGLLWLILFLWACDVVEVDPVSPNNNFDDPVAEDAEVVDIGSGTIPQDPVQFATFLHNNSSKVWVAEQFTIAGLSAFQQCRLDDSMVLSSDGTYQYDGGDQLCGAEDDASAKVGAWEFNAENAVMTFDPGTESEVSVNIITLSESTVVLSGQYVSELFGTFELMGSYSSN